MEINSIPQTSTPEPVPGVSKVRQLRLLLSRLPKIDKKTLVTVLVIAALAATGYYFRGQVFVATVNSRPITRWTLLRRLEQQAGAPALDGLITEALVYQEAARQGVKVTDEELAEEIAQLEISLNAQGQELDQLLEAQGVTRDEMREQVRLQTLVEKMVGQDVGATEEDISEYLTTNSEFLPEDTDPDELKETARVQIEQQKLSMAVQNWLGELHEGAKINYWLEL